MKCSEINENQPTDETSFRGMKDLTDNCILGVDEAVVEEIIEEAEEEDIDGDVDGARPTDVSGSDEKLEEL